MTSHRKPRAVAMALIAGLSLFLTGCLVTPGKFTSELILVDEDRFTFTYDGEIFFLGLSSLAEMGASAEEFEPEICYDEETLEERECTQTELSAQREAWEAEVESRAARAAQQAEQFSTLMGGIDPNDPEASAELLELLLRQKGWERVVDKGEGVFDVRYSVSGRLSHEFMFPVIEGFPSTNPFVQILLRDGQIARVNAPGFSTQNETNPMTGLLGGMAGLTGIAAIDDASDGSAEIPALPTIEGTFTILTTGTIRANNTDEGATSTPDGQRLVWDISPRTRSAPTALIELPR